MTMNECITENMENARQRMAVYIDLHNVEKGMEGYNLHGLRLNYSELIDEISEGYDVVCVKTYDSTESDDRELKELHDCLGGKSFGLVLKKPQLVQENGKSKMVQKEVDTSIVADVIGDAYEDVYDVCMVVSGDRDMCPCIRLVHGRGKKFLVSGFEISMATCLKDNSDGCTLIEDTMALEAVQEEGKLLTNYASRQVVLAGGETDAQ